MELKLNLNPHLREFHLARTSGNVEVVTLICMIYVGLIWELSATYIELAEVTRTAKINPNGHPKTWRRGGAWEGVECRRLCVN